MCENIKINSYSDAITPLNIALAKDTKLDFLYVSDGKAGASANSFADAVNQDGKVMEKYYKQSTISFSIDDLIEIYKLNIPNHIKLDVDGIEYEILQGATNTLSKSNLRSVIVEISLLKDSALDLTINLLKQHGFRLNSIAGHSIKVNSRLPKRGYCFNYFFTK